MKPKLRIEVRKATHFLQWEVPPLAQYFELVDKPGQDAILMVFGPDALIECQHLPALFRVVILFPGFAWYPFHNLEHRALMMTSIEENYKIAFINPGPFEIAFKESTKISVQPFSLDSSTVQCKAYRKQISSLLHASADYPQKDWRRSEKILIETGLPFEIYPSRTKKLEHLYNNTIQKMISRNPTHLSYRINWRFRQGLQRIGLNNSIMLYRPHTELIQKMQSYDGFVHVAGQVPGAVDGKYTATLLEAGLTGAILFWHDTFGLGNDFEAIFDLPLDPQDAAEQIKDIAKSIDVEKHSRRTREEILDRCDAGKVIAMRASAIQAHL